MVEEITTINKSEVWDLVDLIVERMLIGIKWVFKKKFNVEGRVEEYKYQLLAKGYFKVEGIFAWGFRIRNLHEEARRICCERKEIVSMQVGKFHVWVKEITKYLV